MTQRSQLERDKLIKEHIGYVLGYAEKVRANRFPNLDPQDAASLAMQALLEYATSFDSSFGTDFKAMVAQKIKWKFLNMERKLSHFSRTTGRQTKFFTVSLETEISPESDITLADTLKDESFDEAENADAARETIEPLLNPLKPEYAEMVKMHFGLNGFDKPMQMKEIAERVGKTTSRISQIIDHSIRRMRRNIERKPEL
jgi:RNA polymerase sigma factor (sigma-70 family)